MQVLAGHTDGVLGGAFSPDGRTLATCSCDETSILWRVDEVPVYKAMHIRPAKHWEVYVPLVSLVTSLCQRVALSVSEDLPWNPTAIAPARLGLKLSLFDLQLSVSAAVTFWIKSVVSLVTIGTFIVCAATGKGAPVVRSLGQLCVKPGFCLALILNSLLCTP